MKTNWIGDAREVGKDPASGAVITRIAGGGVLYPESPKSSPDGKRFVLTTNDAFHVCDLESMKYARIDEKCTVANSSYNEYFYCWHRRGEHDNKQDSVYRVSLSTLEREHVITTDDWPKPYGVGATACHEKGWLLYMDTAPHTGRLIRVNLNDGSWRVVHEDPSMTNAHCHFEPEHGDDIVYQQNVGGKLDAEGKLEYFGDGATHYVISSDGGNIRRIPVADPYTASSSGHSCWMGHTDRYAVCINWNHNEFNEPGRPEDWSCDDRFPGSTLMTATPGDAAPTPFFMPEHRCYMVSVTPDGKFFVCSSAPARKGPTCIVMGNFETGKYRTLINDGHNYAGSVWPCSLPYLTADHRHVIYRARDAKYNDTEKYGKWAGFEVFVARVPDAFIADLL